MTGKPTIFRNVSPDSFPFTIAFHDHYTGELVDTIEVCGPGVTEIPGFAPRKVDVVVTFANGEVVTERWGDA